ncbi:cupin domain-containing protein [Pseudosulfitobacter pseudonitzschiae]|uniref:cupin domain-containing protein n=1 Tax=Pseudosulfitobacter pseudonitzschiae TaxID=1402135 RepID=UPI003B765E65
MPKIETHSWNEHAGEPNPLSGQNDGPYAEIPLGDSVGLSQFGVHLERLPAGSRSSHRHWHEKEDEFIYLVSGELVLIEDEETLLHSGDAAGWKAGQPIAHCLENRSDSEAVFLVVGARTTADVVHYPDHDVILRRDLHGKTVTRLDGSPIPRKR